MTSIARKYAPAIRSRSSERHRDAVPVCPHAVAERRAAVSGAADVREDAHASAGGHTRDLEHVDRLLPARPPRRISLFPRDTSNEPAPPGLDSCHRAAAPPARVARSDSKPRARGARPSSVCLAVPRADGFGRTAVLRSCDQCAHPPAMVRLDDSLECPRPVLSLCREQRRKSSCTCGVSVSRRAAPQPLDPASVVDDWIWRLCAPDPGVCLIRSGMASDHQPDGGSEQPPSRDTDFLVHTASMARPGRRTVEPHAQHEHAHHHRYCRGAAALGRAAGHLPDDVRPRFRAT